MPIFDLIKAGDPAAIELEINNLGAKETVSEKGKYNISPLQLASAENKISIVEILLASGADPSQPDDYGVTAFSAAIGHFAQRETLLALLNSHIDILAKDNSGATALHVASRCGNIEAVDLILSHYGDNMELLNAKNDQGWSAIDMAANSVNVNSAAIIEHLVKHGATLELHNLTQAAYVGNNEAIAYIAQQNNELLNLQDENGKTCLDYAHSGIDDETIANPILTFELLELLGAYKSSYLEGQLPQD